MQTYVYIHIYIYMVIVDPRSPHYPPYIVCSAGGGPTDVP